MSRRRFTPPLLTSVDGVPADSETLVCAAGAFALVLSTTLPDVVVSVHSSYLGHPHDETIISELRLGQSPPRVLTTRTVSHVEMPVAWEPRRCLYHHLLTVQESVAASGRRLEIVIDDASLSWFDECVAGSPA